MKACILLTATIKPFNVPNLKRVNELQRENDYFEAIKYYVKFNIPIVFCENSNTHSEKIIEVFSRLKVPFEYLTFQSKLSIEGKGKGEAEILEYAFTNSNIINKCENIIKITGRYKVKRFSQQIKDLRNDTIYVNLTKNLSYADSRFFIMNSKFYLDYLSKIFDRINEKTGVFMEHILLSSTLKYIADYNNWCLLKKYPVYIGVYGTDNVIYNNNIFKLKLKQIAYSIKRFLLNKGI
jgi:hypothetical protein